MIAIIDGKAEVSSEFVDALIKRSKFAEVVYDEVGHVRFVGAIKAAIELYVQEDQTNVAMAYSAGRSEEEAQCDNAVIRRLT